MKSQEYTGCAISSTRAVVVQRKFAPTLANGAEAGCDPLAIHQSLDTLHQNCWPLSQITVFGVTLAVCMAHSRRCETDTAVGLFLKVVMPITRRESWSMIAASH